MRGKLLPNNGDSYPPRCVYHVLALADVLFFHFGFDFIGWVTDILCVPELSGNHGRSLSARACSE